MLRTFFARTLQAVTLAKENFCRRIGTVSRQLCPPHYLSYGRIGSSKESVFVFPPSDYWCMQVRLDVDTPKEAAAFAPSLFDLDEGYRYEATAVSSGEYLLLAYNPHLLATRYGELLKDTSRRICFAQWAFETLDVPVRLGGGKCLILHEGIVMEVDETYVDLSDSITLNEMESRPVYPLKTLNAVSIFPADVSAKTVVVALSILIILAFNLLSDVYQTYTDTQRLETRSAELLEQTGLSAMSMEREAIIDTLKHKASRQLHLRERCFALKALPFHSQSASLTPSPTPAPVLAGTGGIVLIPGSKPGEANRLLVNGTSDTPTVPGTSDGVREVRYEGKNLTFLIDSSDPQELQPALRKLYRDARIESFTNRLEVKFR